MAIPTIYPPVRIGDGLYIDGGVCMNFPFCVFPKAESFGLWLQHKGRSSSGPDDILSNTMTYFKAIGLSLFYSQDVLLNDMLLPDYRDQIVVIPAPFASPIPGADEDVHIDAMQRQGFMAIWFHLHHFSKECPHEQLLRVGLEKGLLRLPIRRCVHVMVESVFWVRLLLDTLLRYRIVTGTNRY